ncbi:MAG: SecD/SecF family protein translocase subunit, partial [Rickettsiales bacterium]|nr:SecD/SecF family protein translocase subunit [Rickettsiales bacterium]
DSVVLLKDVKDTYELPVGEKLSLDGDLLTDAAVVYNNGKPVINFKFNSVGAKKFAEITKDNIGRVLVMVLDNKVVAAPRINGRIDGGSGTIVGNFTDKEATEIVMLLKIGSLIAPISVVEEKIINIPPGRDLIRKRIHICAIGFALVFGLVFVIYGSLGMFLCATLIISIFVQIALLTLFSVILTLTGMVSLLLSTGISIGTTIVIFEKIKKECKNNKNISVAGIVKNSFDKAYATIFNLHAIITTGAIILYIFNINSTRDLATILMWGIVSSLISNLVYLRTILDMFYSNKKRGEI